MTLAGLGTISPAIGGGVPVHDVAAEATRLQQLTHLVNQLSTLRSQLAAARSSLDALTGSAGYGSWHLRSLESALPAGQSELARLLAGGQVSGSTPILRDRLREEFQLEIEASPHSSGSAAGIHNDSVRGSHGLEAVARTAYEEAVRDLEAVVALSAAIDRAGSVKASMDLQNRLLAQNAKSILAAARLTAAAEAAAARRIRMDAERSLRLRRLATVRFHNPVVPVR